MAADLISGEEDGGEAGGAQYADDAASLDT